MLDICFLGGVYPHEIEKELYKNSKWGISYAANNHQWRLIEGFEENSFPLHVVSAPYLSTYMRGYKKLYVPECFFGPSSRYHSVGYRNVFLFGNEHNKLMDGLEKWYKNSSADKKCILIYCLNAGDVKAAVKMKEKHPDLVLCQMVPDLPMDMACNKLYRLLGLKKRDIDFIDNSMDKMSMFIFLSKYMNDSINKHNKPYLISEGVFKQSDKWQRNEKLNRTILYTGNLNKKYGIEHLVKAFQHIDDSYTLLVRGDGDMVNYVKSCSVTDKRIHYLERMDYSKLQELQRKANILINPVLPSESFTKNFFPSKTMEYLASGTPVIMYKLGGVPDEYYNYIFVPDSLTDLALAKKIEEVCSLDKIFLEEHTNKARNFILSQKNSKVMVKKIIDFIQNNS